MTVAIIPARGGSKRIPGKNIRPFLGKPIISRSIETALQSGIFDRVIVSTDSDRIAEVAEASGAEVPFRRPEELADDITPTAPVVQHAVAWLNSHGVEPEYVCCIYPTAPFMRISDLKVGYDLIRERGVGSVFTVTSFAFPIFRSLKLAESGAVEMFWPEHEVTRSQDLPDAYHDAGQFYWLEVERLMSEGRLYTTDALPLILPRYLVQDLDTLEDWDTAQHMYRAIIRKETGEQ